MAPLSVRVLGSERSLHRREGIPSPVELEVDGGQTAGIETPVVRRVGANAPPREGTQRSVAAGLRHQIAFGDVAVLLHYRAPVLFLVLEHALDRARGQRNDGSVAAHKVVLPAMLDRDYVLLAGS